MCISYSLSRGLPILLKLLYYTRKKAIGACFLSVAVKLINQHFLVNIVIGFYRDKVAFLTKEDHSNYYNRLKDVFILYSYN